MWTECVISSIYMYIFVQVDVCVPALSDNNRNGPVEKGSVVGSGGGGGCAAYALT